MGSGRTISTRPRAHAYLLVAFVGYENKGEYMLLLSKLSGRDSINCARPISRERTVLGDVGWHMGFKCNRFGLGRRRILGYFLYTSSPH